MKARLRLLLIAGIWSVAHTASANPAAQKALISHTQEAVPAQSSHPNAKPTAHSTAQESHQDASNASRESSAEEPIDKNGPSPAEIAGLLRIGAAKHAAGDYAVAESAYRQALTARNATRAQQRDALIGLARAFRGSNRGTQAAATYEKFLQEFPGDENSPTVYLELGRTLRSLGAHRQALARFYSVINSTLKLPEQGAETYRQLARTAQFEIAETHFLNGDYSEASRFYGRLRLLDLAPEDRAKAHFKSAFALSLAGDIDGAIAGLNMFLAEHPDDENIPEARYLLATNLRKLNRNKEAISVTIDLLRTEQARTSSNPKRWAYWQRRTGNQIANDFYEQGDATNALLLYESLAVLSNEPSWLLPVLYQSGLCHERLGQVERARECYQKVVSSAPTSDTPGVKAELKDLGSLAKWRLKHLEWRSDADTRVNRTFGSDKPVK